MQATIHKMIPIPALNKKAGLHLERTTAVKKRSPRQIGERFKPTRHLINPAQATLMRPTHNIKGPIALISSDPNVSRDSTGDQESEDLPACGSSSQQEGSIQTSTEPSKQ